MRQDSIADQLEELASNDAGDVLENIEDVLQYVIDVHNRYRHVLNFNNRESDYHGGFLMNFRYRHIAGIYLELFIGGGYADITFLVRGVERLRDSVPIIIELKAGQKSAMDALEQAEDYVNTCPVSSLSIHTSSETAVCVGLNFDLIEGPCLMLSTQDFIEKGFSLLERLFNGTVNEIKENVRNYLLYPSFGIPTVPDSRGSNSRRFSYTTGFAFSCNAFAKGTISTGKRGRINVTKFLFEYNANSKMLGQHGRVSQVSIGDRALTMIFRALLGGNERIVVLDIRHELPRHQFPLRCLNLSRWPDARVYEVMCQLDPARRNADDLGLTVDVNTFHSYASYLQDKGGQHFQGNLLSVGGVSNVHNAAKVMMNTGWRNVDKYSELFNTISNVLFPLKWVVNRNKAQEVGFQSILHGLFYTCDNPARVIIEFQLGGGQKANLVLLRSVQDIGDTHPIVIELKFAHNNSELQQKRVEADIQIESYFNARGYKRITDGDTVVLSYVIFDNNAQQPDTLISVKDVLRIKGNLEHSSVYDLPYR